MVEACYPFNSPADGFDPMTLWTDGGSPQSLGNALGNGCVPMFSTFSPGHTYTVSYESVTGTYLENSNPGGDTGSSPDPNLPYSGARYNNPGLFPSIVGGGDWQVSIDVYTFPVSPPEVSLYQANDATVHLAFTGDGDPFATFNVSCTSTVGGTFTANNLLQSDSPIQITGMGQNTPLTPPGFTPITYNTVTCSVSEFNLGSGPAATVSAQLVPTSGPGCPATDVTAPTVLSSASEAFPGAVVSWKPATATPQNCINGYQITPIAGTGALAPITVNGVNSTSVVVSGLTEGSTYTFTVAAITGSGVGPQSDPTGPVTIGTPATPSAVSASKVMNGAIQVSFKAPKDNGAAIGEVHGEVHVVERRNDPVVVAPLHARHGAEAHARQEVHVHRHCDEQPRHGSAVGGIERRQGIAALHVSSNVSAVLRPQGRSTVACAGFCTPSRRRRSHPSGRDRRRSGDPTLFRRVLCRLSYPAGSAGCPAPVFSLRGPDGI